MMQKRMVLCGIITSLIGFNLHAESTVDLKVRYVKSSKIAANSEQGKKLQKDLMAKNKDYTDKRDSLSKELQDEEAKLQKLAQEYNAKRAALSEATRATEEKKLSLMYQQMQTKGQAAQNELQIIGQQVEELKQKYFEEIRKAAERIAKKDGLDAIHDEETGMVLFVSNKGDITDKLIADLNNDHAIKLASAGTKAKA